MNLLRGIDFKTILFIVLGCVTAFVYLSKNNQIDSLKDKTITTQEDLIKNQRDLRTCENKLQEQNRQIEDMRVEVTYKEPETIEKINNIYLKDKTCEAELKAYKELFND
ncbi:hypothetical protein [Aliarcobacter vitoriensis]|uniref:Uncharacterized protein n=1 Tax=Aliarcobacter vitoriensis TaxID=2011099 RepID=A0A366MQ42_9BACT|nr:hypothetical protein [Aliarcobacter vitoriensis]RBQ28411.1 hypothetical protein CRU91_09325 [Aliarcobacter vitoriensis]